MSYTGAQPRYARLETESFDADGSTGTFALTYAPGVPEGILVFLDNVFQEPRVSYTVSGKTLVFVGANPSGRLIVMYRGIEGGSVIEGSVNIYGDYPLVGSPTNLGQFLTQVNSGILGVVVADRTAAEALPIINGLKVHIKSEDGGDFILETANSPYTSDGGSYCGTIIALSGGTAGLVRVRQSNSVDITWYGAFPTDGSTTPDCSTALTLAYNAVSSSVSGTDPTRVYSTGGEIIFTADDKKRHYYFASGSSTLLLTSDFITIRGLGGPVIHNLSGNPVFAVGDGYSNLGLWMTTSEPSFVTISDLMIFDYAGGDQIEVRGGHFITITNLLLRGNDANTIARNGGIRARQFQWLTVSHNRIEGFNDYGILVETGDQQIDHFHCNSNSISIGGTLSLGTEAAGLSVKGHKTLGAIDWSIGDLTVSAEVYDQATYGIKIQGYSDYTFTAASINKPVIEVLNIGHLGLESVGYGIFNSQGGAINIGSLDHTSNGHTYRLYDTNGSPYCETVISVFSSQGASAQTWSGAGTPLLFAPNNSRLTLGIARGRAVGSIYFASTQSFTNIVFLSTVYGPSGSEFYYRKSGSVTITAASTTYVLAHGVLKAPERYHLHPSWDTTVFVTAVDDTSIYISFGTAPGVDSTLRWAASII